MLNKILSIASNDMGGNRDINLLFTFKNPDGEDYICWKVAKFGAKGRYWFRLEYHQDRLAFIKPTITTDDTVLTGLFQPIDVGQQTTLIQQGPFSAFTPPTAIRPPSGGMRVVNDTPHMLDLAFGLVNPDGNSATPLLYLSDVGQNSHTDVNFVPILSAYVVSEDYNESQVIRGGIDGVNILQYDLRAAPNETRFQLVRDPVSGAYHLYL